MFQNAIIKTLIPTAKPDAAKTFYRDILNFTLLSEDDYGIEFDANGISLRLSKMPEFTPQGFTILGWEVPDIEEDIIELNGKGIFCEKYNFDFMKQDDLGIWVSPGGTKVAWFKDVDGNVLSLSQV